jgi:hypothetical protein
MGLCSMVICLTYALTRRGYLQALAPAMMHIGLLLGLFYLMLIFMYLFCWARLLWAMFHRKTLAWGQIKGVGLRRALLEAGIALLVPLFPTLVVLG